MVIILVIFFPERIGESSQTRQGLSLGLISSILTILTSLYIIFKPFLSSIKEKLLPVVEISEAEIQKQRSPMIDLVRQIWIKGFFESSLQNLVLIELGVTEWKDKVDSCWNLVVQQPDHSSKLLPSSNNIIDLFDDVNGSFLILGEPGSGKTTILLQLAKSLLDRADGKMDFPIPVVFNLSSWAVKRSSLEIWLVDELEIRYQIPRKLGNRVVESNSILPLLDGLDEVAQDHRDGCVRAINLFKRTRGLHPLVVCSRKNEYEALRERLQLPTAVFVEPLTPDQIRGCLDLVGPGAAEVNATLENDPELWELLKTPLMLNLMILAFRSLPKVAIHLKGSPEEQRRQIFDYYKEAMFVRPLRSRADDLEQKPDQQPLLRKILMHLRGGRPASYTHEQTEHWLSWLARSMKRHDQSIFYLEWMQPDWLHSQRQQEDLKILFGLVIGLVFGLMIGVACGLTLGLGGLAAGLFVGLMSGLSYVLAFRPNIRPVEKLNLKWDLHHVVIGLVIGLVVGLVFWLAGRLVIEQGFRPVEWQANALAKGLATGLLIGLMSGPVFGLAWGLFFWLRDCMVPADLETKSNPNEGIHRSATIALKIGIIFFLAMMILSRLLLASFDFLIYRPFIDTGLTLQLLWMSAVLTGALFGGLFFFDYGGGACILHYLLRIILFYHNFAPLDYVGFLEYASDRIFLKRIGGGYTFIHRMLMDYFASLEQD